MGHRRKALVTGVGILSAQGRGMDAHVNALRGYALAGEHQPSLQRAGVPVQMAACVPQHHQPDPPTHAPTAHFARAAADDAVRDAGLARAPCAVSIGCGMGHPGALAFAGSALSSGERRRAVGPRFSASVLPNAPASAVAIDHRSTGSCLAPSTACAAGAHAIRDALMLIQSGEADAVLAGGAEACADPVSMLAFARARALSSTGVARPFDTCRDGFVLAEGASVLLVESDESARSRGAAAYAEITGAGSTCDAHHEMAPMPDGDGGARAMEMALSSTLRNAHDAPATVDYVNCHAAGTPAGDVAEAFALRKVFCQSKGRSVPSIGSLKGTLGHMLGAAGAAETAITCYAMHKGFAPGTPGLEELDRACLLPPEKMLFVNDEHRQVDLVLSNSFGFGGTNACIALRRVGQDGKEAG